MYDAAAFAAGKAAVSQMQRDLGARDPAAQYEVFDAAAAKKEFLVEDGEAGVVQGAFRYPAGSISAYKFGTSVLKLGLEKGLNLQTDTPVLGVEKIDEEGQAAQTNGASEGQSGTQKDRWVVKTERGEIKTSNVIFATNGYSAQLLPELLGNVVPYRGQVIAQTLGSKLRSLKPDGLPTTYSFIYSNGYEYMIPRPFIPAVPDDCRGDIIIGGGLGHLPDDGVAEFGNTDDTVIDEQNSKYLRKTNEIYFGSNWGPPEDAPIKKEWTGIMGATKDGSPFVGQWPGANGLWISVGFNGHGMVLCLKCAEALAGMIFGQKVERGEKLDWFPRNFLVTKERLANGTFQGRKNGQAIVEKPKIEVGA